MVNDLTAFLVGIAISLIAFGMPHLLDFLDLAAVAIVGEVHLFPEVLLPRLASVDCLTTAVEEDVDAAVVSSSVRSPFERLISSTAVARWEQEEARPRLESALVIGKNPNAWDGVPDAKRQF